MPSQIIKCSKVAEMLDVKQACQVTVNVAVPWDDTYFPAKLKQED